MSTTAVRPDILYAWKGPALFIVNTRGECRQEQRLSGFYYREARFLRVLQLEVNGERPWLCEASAIAPDLLSFAYVHPEITQPGGGGTGQSGDEVGVDAHDVPERALDIRASQQLHLANVEIALAVTNRSRRTVSVMLSWQLDADYADIQEAQNDRRKQSASVGVSTEPGELIFTYQHETLSYRTHVRHEPEWKADGKRLARRATLAPGETLRSTLSVIPAGDVLPKEADAETRARALESWREAFTRIDAPGNRIVESILAANVRDFGSFPMMTGAPDEWLSLQAGVPLYPAFFGRDAVTAGWQAAMIDRGAALDAALTRLGRCQSNRHDDWHDEQPGRLPYQMRTGPLALLNVNPYSAYYADFASPLMFVISLANLFAWSGDVAAVGRHWDAARRILDWAREYGDADRDGYLEYQTRSSEGTKNQGWKDSGDAIVYPDGSPVPSPIATCELQGYWYIAQRLAGLLAGVMGSPEDAAAHEASATDLKRRFNRDWWDEESRSVLLALGPQKERVRAVTSNAGHCLACGIVDDEHLPVVVGRLFEPDMFSGWGIRTLSSDHTFYDPQSYHRGSVWAVEQGTIVFGLRRFGFNARALDLTRAMFDLAQLYPEYRVPECVGGDARGEHHTPGAYPRTNTPQLWNATAFPIALQSMLGLVPLAPVNTLVIDPILPTWLPELTVSGLRVGDASATLRFWRDGDRSKWEVVHKRGTLHVVRQPPPEAKTGAADRFTALMETMVKS
jgi:glycogen debranching enzyme